MSARHEACPPEMVTICPNVTNDHILTGYTGPTQGRPLRTNGAYGINGVKVSNLHVWADFMSARNEACPPEMVTIRPNVTNERVLTGYTGPT